MDMLYDIHEIVGRSFKSFIQIIRVSEWASVINKIIFRSGSIPRFCNILIIVKLVKIRVNFQRDDMFLL